MPETLDELLARIRACRICLDAANGRPLPHEPRPVVIASKTARVLIASQAPGIRVHASGKPFDDRSGDRLREWMGVTQDEFYDPSLFAIVPMGFCFPGYDAKGSDLPPRRECAPAWRAPLMAHMPQIELVLLIGQYAQAWHIPAERRPNMTQTVSAWREIYATTDPHAIVLPHPSWRNTGWLKKNSWFETDLLPVLRDEVHKRM